MQDTIHTLVDHENHDQHITAMTPGPIDRVPPEILIEIFVLATQEPGDDHLALKLTGVCRSWRAIVRNTCRVWQKIHLRDDRSYRINITHSIIWIEYSRTLPLDVSMHMTNGDDMLLNNLSMFLGSLNRWRSCTLTGFHEYFIDLEQLRKKSGSTADRVEHFQLVLKDIAGLEMYGPLWDADAPGPDPETEKFPLRLFLGRAEELVFRITLSHVPRPRPHKLSWVHTITELTIGECAREVSTDPVDILSFLGAFFNVEVFRYYDSPSDGSRAPYVRRAAIPLHKLRVLLLDSTCFVRTFLSNIDAPGLEKLYLRHTNNDFQLRHDPYADIYEDGDSDDEARDFSQSPWSDHATGMGLRSLLARCNPPLKLLVMDYSDMRTKDFKWCFDRLDKLEAFHIVASDMSDCVVKLLAPYRAARPKKRRSNSLESRSRSVISPVGLLSMGFRRRGGSDAGIQAEGSAVSADVGTDQDAVVDDEQYVTQVRMPKLRNLRLVQCQQLSGDEVVNALQARARFTDAAVKREWYDGETLAEVAVVRCMNVTVHHALDLSAYFGNRRFRST